MSFPTHMRDFKDDPEMVYSETGYTVFKIENEVKFCY